MNTTRIKIPHLHCFLEVARLGDLDLAAEQLAVDRATVQAAIAALEKQIGVPLFDRGSPLLSLTPAGERLRPHANRGMDALHEGILRRAQEECGDPGRR